MLKGIIFALAACFIWGLIFIVPQFMDGFSPIEIAIGRYSFYGIISCCLLLKGRLQGTCQYPLSIWARALYFSLMSTFIYYVCVILSLRYSTPAICALILGISPITIAFYGNWKQKECSFRSLILPSILILVGLVIINAPHFTNNNSSLEFGMGLLCSALALIAWSWYVVANSKFLKTNPHVVSDDWATLIGVSTIFWVAICGLCLGIFFRDQLEIEKYVEFKPEMINFLIGSAILGILCSWVGGFLWNRASFHLPVSLAGQLTIFETIFGLIFVYILAQTLPAQLELLGIVLLLGSVMYGIRLFTKPSPINSETPRQ